MTSIRIMIVDDHAIVAEGLEKVIGTDRRLEVMGSARTLAEACKMLEEVSPDVILLDLRLPDSRGVATISAVKQRCGSAKIIVLTGFPDPKAAEQMGVDAYLDKQTASDVLVTTIRELFHMDAIQLHSHQAVTSRELQVAQLAADGLSNSEIARKLSVSPNTIKTHLSQVFIKFGVRDRVDLARRWNTIRQQPDK
jgi:DNA-binding NarL/FixJ family response regulator